MSWSAVFTTRRAATLIVVSSLSMLFDVSGSYVSLLTLASLGATGNTPGFTSTTIVIVSTSPGAIAPKLQLVGRVTSPGTPKTQDAPPVPLTSTIVVPAGTMSETTTFVAVDGPLFVTSSVYVIVVPASTGSGAPGFVIERT